MIYRGGALRRKGVGWLRMGQGKELSRKVLSAGDELQPDPLGALQHDLCHRAGPTLKPKNLLSLPPYQSIIGYRFWAEGGEGGDLTSQVRQVLLD